MKSRNVTWAAVLAILLAYLLRTFSLDLQSFWIDEVYAFYFINRPLQESISMLIRPEHNGPLYFLLLWIWRRLGGASDFSLRYFSTLSSVLTVAVVWQLARTWFGRRTAGFAALLLAISPFAIWFGQEAKMYALHMLLAGLSTLLLVKALRGNRWYHWLGYAIALNLLAYSHFFGAFTIASQGILVVLTSLNRWHSLRSYILTMVLSTIPYLPVVRFVLSVLPSFQNQDISKGFVPLPDMLVEFAAEYFLRVSRANVPHLPRLLVFGAVVVGLAVYASWKHGWRKGLWFTGLMVLPAAIFYPISYRVPVFSPKYLSASFLILMIGMGLVVVQLGRWWRPLTWFALAGFIALSGWGNVRILANSEYQRSDWKATAAYLETQAQPGDAVIAFAHYVDEAVTRYYDGDMPVYSFQANPYDPQAYYQALQQANNYHTLWLVLHHDQAMAPQHRLREVAGTLYPQITGVFPNNGQIAVLGYNARWWHSTLPAGATPVSARFENGMSLVGYSVDTLALKPYDDMLHPPSNWLHVTTYWQRSSTAPLTPGRTVPFIHLVDTNGGVWGGELQRYPTVFDFDPPTGWDTDTLVEAHYDINLNPVTPPGSYRLVVGLLDETGTPVGLGTEFPEFGLTEIDILP